MAKNGKKGADTYELVTNRILEMLDKGIVPWQKPWCGGLDGAVSYSSGKPYSLLNQFLLGRTGEYLTWKQICDLGGSVKKGSASNFVVFFKMIVTSEYKKNDKGEMEEVVKKIPVLRHYSVFHISDCEGIESKMEKRLNTDLKPVDEAEKVVSDYFGRESCRLDVINTNRACYSPSADRVQVPLMEQYKIVEEYYSTLFHEMTHSTGHSSRLAREFGSFFDNEAYSKEELIAEIGSAFLCNKCGLDSEKAFTNSVAYIKSWAKALKQDKFLIVSAASKAEKAVRYILTGERPTPV